MATHFSSTPDNYNYGDINALDGVSALSLCVWHYQTAGENTGGGAGVSVASVGKGAVIYLFKNDGGGGSPKIFGFGDGAGTAFSNTNVIVDATWQHLGWTYDGSLGAGSRATLYLNGASTTKASDTLGASFATNASSVIAGSGAAAGLSGWQGNLGYLKAWTATLSASEMLWECLYAEPQRIANLQLFVPLVFNTVPGATYDGTNALSSTAGTPTTSTVSEPPVIWPAGARIGHRNNYRGMDALRRNRFQRIGPKRPLVQYG